MTDDGALVRQAAGGDADAFAALVTAHRPYVVRIARHLLGDAASAEDIAQDAFVRLQSALPGFRGQASLQTWLYRVTLNLCRDHARRQQRRRDDGDLSEVEAADAAIAESAGRRIDAERMRRAVRAAIDRLPDQQREAVVLRFLEELSYAEIARLTDTPQGTVASRVFRALERLGRELEPRHLEVVK